ncbi:cytochrome P450 [Lentinula aciculospora]|uniref:Cytochrome P450 n=1 Tax=Lentinula aciculospora TaxID=153920 RepID=A0A9W9AGD8_9AGAR|nr:cytochrome P450 [Lentinula aciculospora]
MSSFEFLALCWSASLIAVYLFRHYNKNQNPLPPGPWSLPWIGNIRYLISRPDWITYTVWYRKYESDIVHLNVAGNSLIILNTLEAATELLERRPGIYSIDRPKLRMLNDLWKWSFISMPYGAEWKAQRNLFINMFNANNPDQHEPRELKSTRLFLLRLHRSSENLDQLILKMAGSIILSVVYGFDVSAVQDSVHIDHAEQVAEGFVQTFLPGSFLVDYIPWLRYVPSWVPGASFQRRAQVWKEHTQKLLNGLCEAMKNYTVSGMSLESCFVSRCLRKLGSDPNEEQLIKHTAGSMYIAGTDTTVTTLRTFFLVMMKYPEYQIKAQRELDHVVGSDRLPNFGDRDSLPYVQAIVYEIIRWQPVAPTGLPRLSSKEDVYNGYRISEGSIVIANIWAMMHDEKNFVDPYTFCPDRYIRADGHFNDDVLKSTVGFGFGRRICPGRHMALSAIWIAIASILSVFDISKAVDGNGKIIEPSMEYITTSLQK